MQLRSLVTLICALAFLVTATATLAQSTPAQGVSSPESDVDMPVPGPEPQPESQGPPSKVQQLLSAAKAYYSAPLHWDSGQWAWFAGAVAAIAGAHSVDSQVRTHFVNQYPPGHSFNSDDLQDALPTVAVLLATMGYAGWTHDSDGWQEVWTMQQSAVLSTVTTYPLKYLVGREDPDQTSNPNEWRKSGGSSFPSQHAAAAFAVGTVLAESGNDDYRWVRRFLGYGLGIGTSFLRLKHNAHWLSDTVAGGALGGATANFSMNRNYYGADSGFALLPVQGGAMLTYHLTLK